MAAQVYGRIRILALLLLLLLQSFAVFPQSKKTQKETSSDKSQPTFKIPVGVVIVNATVVDKHGTAVTDLTQKDFRVYEDGKLQAIQTFALESYKPVQPGETASPQHNASKTVIPGAPDSIRPRLISIIIDDLASTPDDRFVRVTKAVKDFVEMDMEPEDQIQILSSSGRVQYPFSNNKQLLLDEIAALYQKLNVSPVTREECPILTDLQAQMIVNNRDGGFSLEVAMEDTIKCLGLDTTSENSTEALRNLQLAEGYVRAAASRQYQETAYRNRALLQALRQHLRLLRHFDAIKSAILFSDGFLHEDVMFELQDVVEQALRSGVVLNTVDIRGLFNQFFIPVSERTISSAAMSLKQRAYADDASAQEDPLSQLAGETGGIFYHNSNDIYGGIQKISSRQDYYYVLTYAAPPHKADGRYHSIKVEVNRPGLQISYRKGYFAPREEMTFERRKKEDILEALHAPGNLNEIPMGLSYNYYQDDDTAYAVSLLVKVDIRGLHFLNEDSRYKNLISMVVVAFDEEDHYINGLEKSIDFRLTDTSYANLLDRGITSKIEFRLSLGRYKIKAVVREATQGKMGSLTKAIEIP
jgi:VWFA-related protein